MLESLLNTYGYPLILIGTFLEGETILLLGGVSAHMGYLSLGWVITCGFAGALFDEQIAGALGWIVIFAVRRKASRRLPTDPKS